MRGIVYTGEDAEVTDKLGIADPGPTEVKIKIVAAGVCHSDLSVLDGTIPWKAPSVLGHEGAGIVDSVGSSVRSVKPGDHVVVATLASCGTCRACNTGHPTMCIRSLGNVSTPFTYDGEPASNFAAASVFAEYTIVQEVQAVPISKDVPFTSACLIGCGVLTGVGSVLNRAKVAPGETSAVFGVGGVGLNVIQALRLSAASRIVAVDTMASKEDLAMQFGATHFIDASKADAVEEIKKIVPHGPKSMARALGPGGVTWAFDCVGHPAVLRNAIDALDWGGTAVAIGVPPRGSEVSVDINNLAYVDRGLIGCRYGASRPHHDIPLMVELYLSGKLMLDELVTETLPLDGFRQIVDDMHAGKLARGCSRSRYQQEGRDPRRDGSGRLGLPCRRHQQRGVDRVAHVAALDQHLGHRRQVQPGQVVARRHAVGPVVGAHRHRRLRHERVAHVRAEHLRRRHDGVVDAVGHGLEHGEPPTVGGAPVGVDRDRRVRIRVVADGGALCHARTHARIGRPRQHDRRTFGPQVGRGVLRHVEVELRLGVAPVGLGAGRVAALVLAPVPDQRVDERRIREVVTVVARVDRHHLALER